MRGGGGDQPSAKSSTSNGGSDRGVSRASVSRLLSEARRQGIVQIEITPPEPVDVEELAKATADTARILDAIGRAVRGR